MAALRKRCRHVREATKAGKTPRPERCGCAWYADYREGDGKRHQVNVGTDHKEAQRQLRALVGGGIAGLGSTGFSEVADAFIGDAQRRCRPQTIRSYEAKVQHAKDYFGDVDIRRIDGAMIYGYGMDLSRSPAFSARYARDLRTFVVMILNYAADLGLIDGVPHVPKMRLGQDAQRDLEIPDLDTVRAIIDRLPAGMQPAMRVLLGTGMRVGELLALEPADVDAAEMTVAVSKTVNTKSGGVGPPKTRRGKRTVYLDADTMQVVQGMILPVPFTYSRLAKAWADARGTDHLTIHGLRHLNVSIRLQAGQPITVVADQVGDTVETVTKTYAHVIKGAARVEAAKISRHLSPSPG